MANPVQILMLDNEQSFGRFIEKELFPDQSRLTFAATAAEAFGIVRKKRFDVMIQNIRLPESNGPALMEKFREIMPETEVILITGQSDTDGISGKRQRTGDSLTCPFETGRPEQIREKTSRPKKRFCSMSGVKALMRTVSLENPRPLPMSVISSAGLPPPMCPYS